VRRRGADGICPVAGLRHQPRSTTRLAIAEIARPGHAARRLTAIAGNWHRLAFGIRFAIDGCVARSSATYQPRAPAARVLYQVVREHFQTFRAEAAGVCDGRGLPRFVEAEFEGFLRCGFLAGGFARFLCEGCHQDLLVPFSCKGRAICPSCGGRRMAERAAHMVDHVLPIVSVRQWVLTVPHRLRYTLAWDHGLSRAVMRIFMRTVLGFLRRRAQRTEGLRDPRSGAVVIVQRFGAALNVNVHGHALVLDGVFTEEPSGTLRFHPAPPPTDDEMDRVLATIERRVQRLLARRGAPDEDGSGGGDAWSEREPVLAGLAAASVEGRVALGPRTGAAVRRCGGSPDLAALSVSGARGPCHARRGGFDLHAGIVVPARDRARLERVCRYALRPPVADDRVRLTATGQVLLTLRHRWTDGTTHLLFDPLELLERLAALTPRPRINLVLYYGVLAAHAAWRSRLPAPDAPAPPRPSSDDADASAHAGTPGATAAGRRGSNMLWAQLLARSFGVDVLACPRCGGRVRLIALIDHPRVVQRILAHLRLPCEVPDALPPRAPPLPLDGAAFGVVLYEMLSGRQAFAGETRGRRQLQLIRRALDLSPECADAYILLAERSSSLDEQQSFSEQGIAAGGTRAGGGRVPRTGSLLLGRCLHPSCARGWGSPSACTHVGRWTRPPGITGPCSSSIRTTTRGTLPAAGAPPPGESQRDDRKHERGFAAGSYLPG
jgi:hypothetical protein